jgi:dienelactone hydrolase
MPLDPTHPFAVSPVRLSGGREGALLTIQSANPVSYEDIVAKRAGLPVELQAALFRPGAPAEGAAEVLARTPAVIIVPGSGGVNPSMLVHAQALLDQGIAALVLDPFTGRSVGHTIADQTQFSFAASTWDVFACMRHLATLPGIDATRLGALGYSRGGLAVIQAGMSLLADAALAGASPLRAVLAGWPWCGYQFITPRLGPTALKIIAADRDDWASVVHTQAYLNAIRALGANVSVRLVRDAHHGFGYAMPYRCFPDAMKALNAPVAYFDRQGVYLDLWSGEPHPGVDDGFIRSQLAGFITRGVTVGTQGTQMADFVADMAGFFDQQLNGDDEHQPPTTAP